MVKLGGGRKITWKKRNKLKSTPSEDNNAIGSEKQQSTKAKTTKKSTADATTTITGAAATSTLGNAIPLNKKKSRSIKSATSLKSPNRSNKSSKSSKVMVVSAIPEDEVPNANNTAPSPIPEESPSSSVGGSVASVHLGETYVPLHQRIMEQESTQKSTTTTTTTTTTPCGSSGNSKKKKVKVPSVQKSNSSGKYEFECPGPLEINKLMPEMPEGMQQMLQSKMAQLPDMDKVCSPSSSNNGNSSKVKRMMPDMDKVCSPFKNRNYGSRWDDSTNDRTFELDSVKDLVDERDVSFVV